jgi:hypothetical protein
MKKETMEQWVRKAIRDGFDENFGPDRAFDNLFLPRARDKTGLELVKSCCELLTSCQSALRKSESGELAGSILIVFEIPNDLVAVRKFDEDFWLLCGTHRCPPRLGFIRSSNAPSSEEYVEDVALPLPGFPTLSAKYTGESEKGYPDEPAWLRLNIYANLFSWC